MYTDILKQQYQSLFNSMQINDSVVDEVIGIVKKIQSFQVRYLTVSDEFSTMPYYFVGIIHCMESSFNFDTHIANGDSLSAKTVHVPQGLPIEGNPPFTWESAAIAEFGYHGFSHWTEWSVPGMLYLLEKWNGFGYRGHGINTPYLWAGSSNYSAGKYGSDGHYDPTLVSKQIGAALILKQFVAL